MSEHGPPPADSLAPPVPSDPLAALIERAMNAPGCAPAVRAWLQRLREHGEPRDSPGQDGNSAKFSTHGGQCG